MVEKATSITKINLITKMMLENLKMIEKLKRDNETLNEEIKKIIKNELMYEKRDY